MSADSPRSGAFKEITSAANPVVKEIRALTQRKHRAETGLFLAEGLKLVADALEANWPVRTVVLNADFESQPMAAQVAATARARGALIVKANQSVMARLTRRENPQAVIGVFRQHFAGLDAVAANPGPVWVGLEDVRDPGNLGTIVRTVDAVAGAGIVLIGDTTDPFGLEAVRASMGSIFHVPIVRVSRSAFLDWRPDFPGQVIGTHLAGAVDYRTVTTDQPILLLMGTEQRGLTAELTDVCDRLVKIPMAGKADSLNLAVSTGVMLYELGRRRLSL
ncbi:TrmH family RNA methyltransferase [Amorphus orientalis]|uniref:TrmH family RNA methyltransferase n=1 Tax=Amorphus orientalis TaxID=649198 RepID=A0AAE3VT33_9HYPH|nr:RNA methyltransferase [Amorphus orientalis]MDQ0317648.1 TrmH family RNA methyltransferase [Amorphus orientalis]